MLRLLVIPTKVGIQNRLKLLDSGFRRNDSEKETLLILFPPFLKGDFPAVKRKSSLPPFTKRGTLPGA